MASSSGYSTSTPPQQYEVFLSFRGEDTRNNFVSHLHRALDQSGIITYLDEHNLENGQSIAPELFKSIEESKFAIIVFSKNYASSTWCLNELVHIMECKTTFGLNVIPVFYDVDPSDVRHQKNSFAESFAKHAVNFKDNMEKVQIWKEALKKAADLVAKDIRGRNEATRIKEIVEEIFGKLRPKAFAKDLVGIEYRMMKLRSLLFRESNGVCVVGIWGMGGIGKTTLARATFCELINSYRFEGNCFLQDVSKREMVDLQKILLSKVLKLEGVYISDAEEGSSMIKDRLRSKRVLLVLDDVNDIKQLKSLAGEHEWFGAGSRIMITTRDKHLLNDVNEIYKMDPLPESEAMELFCLHAFKNSHPNESFVQLSHRVVSYAGGLPLALEVLGSYLRGRGMDEWESALARLKDAPEDDIFVPLKISFEGLNDIHREIFLDIACFFRGNHEDEVKRKLDSFGFHPVDGITVLIQRSLIHISYGEIEMHDLIQEMGWHIVRQKAKNLPGRYSRLWLHDDIYNVLKDNTVTDEIECMVVRESFNIKLSKRAFRNMKSLRLLDFEWTHFSRAPDFLPNSLRWLRWDYYPGKSLPENFEPKKLVTLKLSDSLFVQTPNINGMPNLEVLDLSHCQRLLKVHPSVGVHKKLVRLHLRFCTKLKRLPRIIQMESLKTLDLIYTNIEELPVSHGGLTSLQELDLGFCSKLEYLFENPDGKAIQCWDSQPFSLKWKRADYHMYDCNVSERILPESINCLPCLQVLRLLRCKKLKALPELPSSIKELDLAGCTSLTRILNLVDLLSKCEDLRELSLRDCKKLVQKQETYDSTQSNFLSAFWDWGSVSKVLCARQEMLQVRLPGSEVPDWLNCQSTLPLVTFTLSPSWYNDKLRGFALCSIGKVGGLEIVTCNGVTRTYSTSTIVSCIWKHMSFMYIPIGTIISGREWKEQKDYCLLEVTRRVRGSSVKKWGFCLVYEGEVNVDDSDVRITEDYGTMNKGEHPRLKVCVAPRSKRISIR